MRHGPTTIGPWLSTAGTGTARHFSRILSWFANSAECAVCAAGAGIESPTNLASGSNLATLRGRTCSAESMVEMVSHSRRVGSVDRRDLLCRSLLSATRRRQRHCSSWRRRRHRVVAAAGGGQRRTLVLAPLPAHHLVVVVDVARQLRAHAVLGGVDVIDAHGLIASLARRHVRSCTPPRCRAQQSLQLA